MKSFYIEYKDDVEFKKCEFIPEFGSKLGFYLTSLDEKDNPSIGILLCQSKNNEIVDYTLKNLLQ